MTKANGINYYVIGGQYEYCCYGGTPTLLGAKRLANANKEYWDNWQGWNTPKIYRAEDTKEIEDEYGRTFRVPETGAMPVER